MRSSHLFYPLLGLLILAFACGGNGELKRALETVADNDLAVMVLPQEELGDEFGDLQIDPDSGFVDNKDAADDTIDPDDTAGDLARAGRINGYDLMYTDPDLSALEEGEGVITSSSPPRLTSTTFSYCFRGSEASSPRTWKPRTAKSPTSSASNSTNLWGTALISLPRPKAYDFTNVNTSFTQVQVSNTTSHASF